MVEAAHRNGASVRLLRWGYHACVGPVVHIDGAHEALTAQADWNAATWDMDPRLLEPLAVGIERLYDASKVGITVRAIWQGDDPQRFERVTIDRMLAIVREGSIGTKTVYVVMRPGGEHL